MWRIIIIDKYFETILFNNNFEEVFVYYMLILRVFIYSLLYILINWVYKLAYMFKTLLFYIWLTLEN
jgi:hypothetical protein